MQAHTLALVLQLQVMLFASAVSAGSPLSFDSEVCRHDYGSKDDDGGKYLQFSAEWSVAVAGGIETANQIAEKYGFVNYGRVG
jgi:hypothetical protein